MLSRKVIIGLTTAVVIVVVLGSLLIHSQLQTKTSNDQNTQQQTIPPQVLRAVLSVNGYIYGGYWTRDTATDLPNFVTNVKYSVSNIGNTNAVNISITIHINGKLYSSNLLPLLAFSEVHYSSFSVSTVYDSSSNVLIQTSCQDSTDSYALTVGSMFPRYFPDDPNVVKLFITPKEANVVNMKNAIVQAKFFPTPDWIALRDWVGSNIQYKFDNVSHGQGEYWQFSKETLALRTGDCEDSAILLCSLLRAAGVPATDVYVVVGETQGSGHAWVSFKLVSILGLDSWVKMEPTAGGNILVNFFADLFSTFEGREITCSFNDVYYTGQ